MDASEFPEPGLEIGDPATPLRVQIRFSEVGLPLSITVDKRLCRIRYEGETEERVTIIVESADTSAEKE